MSHEGQCIPTGYCHAHMLLYVSGVNYNVNSNNTNYFAQLCGRIFFRFRISPPQISESGGATYRRNCKMFNALQSTSSNKERLQRPNRCIIGDAILPQTGTKLTKNAILNLALCCGAIWRHREKPQHRCI